MNICVNKVAYTA